MIVVFWPPADRRLAVMAMAKPTAKRTRSTSTTKNQTGIWSPPGRLDTRHGPGRNGRPCRRVRGSRDRMSRRWPIHRDAASTSIVGTRSERSCSNRRRDGQVGYPFRAPRGRGRGAATQPGHGVPSSLVLQPLPARRERFDRLHDARAAIVGEPTPSILERALEVKTTLALSVKGRERIIRALDGPPEDSQGFAAFSSARVSGASALGSSRAASGKSHATR